MAECRMRSGMEAAAANGRGCEQSSAGIIHRAWGVEGGYQGRRELKTVPCIIIFSDYFL